MDCVYVVSGAEVRRRKKKVQWVEERKEKNVYAWVENPVSLEPPTHGHSSVKRIASGATPTSKNPGLLIQCLGSARLVYSDESSEGILMNGKIRKKLFLSPFFPAREFFPSLTHRRAG
jgi:hypothetical protein